MGRVDGLLACVCVRPPGRMRRSREDPAQRVQVTASTHSGPQTGRPRRPRPRNRSANPVSVSRHCPSRSSKGRGVEVVGHGEPPGHGRGIGDAGETALLRPHARECHALHKRSWPPPRTRAVADSSGRGPRQWLMLTGPRLEVDQHVSARGLLPGARIGEHLVRSVDAKNQLQAAHIDVRGFFDGRDDEWRDAALRSPATRAQGRSVLAHSRCR